MRILFGIVTLIVIIVVILLIINSSLTLKTEQVGTENEAQNYQYLPDAIKDAKHVSQQACLQSCANTYCEDEECDVSMGIEECESYCEEQYNK